jgi:hypothetical protein
MPPKKQTTKKAPKQKVWEEVSEEAPVTDEQEVSEEQENSDVSEDDDSEKLEVKPIKAKVQVQVEKKTWDKPQDSGPKRSARASPETPIGEIPIDKILLHLMDRGTEGLNPKLYEGSLALLKSLTGGQRKPRFNKGNKYDSQDRNAVSRAPRSGTNSQLYNS